MEILGGMLLGAVIVCAAVAITTHMTAAARQHIPAHTRQRVRTTGRRVRTTATKASAAPRDGVRHILARAAAQNWLEKKQAKRAQQAGAPPREPRPSRTGPAVRATGRGLKAAGRGAATGGRAIGRGILTVVKPSTTQHVPPRQLRAVPDPQPAGNSRPAQPATQPEPTSRAAQPRQLTTGRTLVMPAGTPADHGAIAHRVGTFEPETDADLLQFMAGEAAGKVAYAQAMEQLTDHLLNGVGLDPQSVQAVHEFAEAQAEAAAIMTRAHARFQQVYQGVREDVARGVVLPYHGRFMTGEGA